MLRLPVNTRDQTPLRHYVTSMRQGLRDAVGSIEDCRYEISGYEEGIRELPQRCQAAIFQSEKLRYRYACEGIDRLYSKYRSMQQDREQSTEKNLTLQKDLNRAVHRMNQRENMIRGGRAVRR
jgi:hypothetical protein